MELGGATIYMKLVKATVPPLANAAWQLVFGLAFIGAGTFVFEGGPHLRRCRRTRGKTSSSWGWSERGWRIFYGGRSPDVCRPTASIGALLVPVVEVVRIRRSILDERLTVNDIIGFVLIFSAAACVLLAPPEKP